MAGYFNSRCPHCQLAVPADPKVCPHCRRWLLGHPDWVGRQERNWAMSAIIVCALTVAAFTIWLAR